MRARIIAGTLHSAIQSLKPAADAKEVELIALATPATEARVIVEDNGRGISAVFLTHVFERFRQEDSSTTRESSGLGLGLSIAKHLVELHGGTISADSEGPGRGSTFTVRFPSTGGRADTAANRIAGR